MAEATLVNVKLTPLGDRVLIKPLEQKETRKGGIIIPDTAKEKPQRGKVIAVGPGKLLEDGTRAPVSVKKGDEVYYGKYSGTEIKMDEVDYLIVHQDDVLGILK